MREGLRGIMAAGTSKAAVALARVLGGPLSVEDATTKADAAVVFGAPLRYDGTVSRVGAERVRAGVELWRRGLVPVVCFSGGRAPRERHAGREGEAMAQMAREVGLPPEATRVEREAGNTRENAIFSGAILRGEGCSRVFVVTQPFHLRRARYWMRRAGFKALGWRIQDSMQFTDGRRALRWIALEYGAWLRLYAIDAASAMRSARRKVTEELKRRLARGRKGTIRRKGIGRG